MSIILQDDEIEMVHVCVLNHLLEMRTAMLKTRHKSELRKDGILQHLDGSAQLERMRSKIVSRFDAGSYEIALNTIRQYEAIFEKLEISKKLLPEQGKTN